jgi:hypothetical protein
MMEELAIEEYYPILEKAEPGFSQRPVPPRFTM